MVHVVVRDDLLQVQDFLMKGLPRNELEASIQKIFRGADSDSSGALDRSEFLRCLRESGLGFTRRELNLVQSESACRRVDRSMRYVGRVPSNPLSSLILTLCLSAALLRKVILRVYQVLETAV